MVVSRGKEKRKRREERGVVEEEADGAVGRGGGENWNEMSRPASVRAGLRNNSQSFKSEGDNVVRGALPPHAWGKDLQNREIRHKTRDQTACGCKHQDNNIKQPSTSPSAQIEKVLIKDECEKAAWDKTTAN